VAWLNHDVNYEGYISQGAADTLLYQMLLKAEISDVTAFSVFYGLRKIGYRAYSNYKNNLLIDVDTIKLEEDTFIQDLKSFKINKSDFSKKVDMLDKGLVEKEIRQLFPEDADKIINTMNKELDR
jgi:hypothetical protein